MNNGKSAIVGKAARHDRIVVVVSAIAGVTDLIFKTIDAARHGDSAATRTHLQRFESVHRDAVARVQKLQPDDLDRSIPFFTGQPISVREVLWDFLLFHGIHHRGQLSLMCRQAGGEPPSLYGPTRETAPLRKQPA